MSELPARPTPPRSLRRRSAEWIEWFGPGRLVLTVVAVVVVVAGGAWLLRTPPMPTEAMLPLASTTTVTATTTDTAWRDAGDATPVTVGQASQLLLVHVAGAVHDPGVHEVPAASRVIDAVESAGGPTVDADLDRLNLAAPLVDGQRVFVPVVGGTIPPEPPTAATATTQHAAGPVDLNRATVGELDALPGIGPATATAIVEHRDRNGPFATVDDLEQVPGIGPAKLEAIRALVTV